MPSRLARLSAAATISKLIPAGAAGCSQLPARAWCSWPARSCWIRCGPHRLQLLLAPIGRVVSAVGLLVVVDPGARRRVALQRYGFHVTQIDAGPSDRSRARNRGANVERAIGIVELDRTARTGAGRRTER